MKLATGLVSDNRGGMSIALSPRLCCLANGIEGGVEGAYDLEGPSVFDDRTAGEGTARVIDLGVVGLGWGISPGSGVLSKGLMAE
jgi:hypothetical protein